MTDTPLLINPNPDTLVILSVSEVSIKKMENGLPKIEFMDFFAAATPCNPLGRYRSK